MATYSLDELASVVNDWCSTHDITPTSRQVGDAVSERNIRFYRTQGLVDPPEDGKYGEKHRLQLTAIRLLQAKGLPLRQIRELLNGLSVGDLRELQQNAV